MESHSLLLGCSSTSTPSPPNPLPPVQPPHRGDGPGLCPHQCQSRGSDLMLSFTPSSLGSTGGQKSKVPFIQNSTYFFFHVEATTLFIHGACELCVQPAGGSVVCELLPSSEHPTENFRAGEPQASRKMIRNFPVSSGSGIPVLGTPFREQVSDAP